MIRAVYDVATGAIALSAGEPLPYRCTIQAEIKRYGQTLDLSGLRYGGYAVVGGGEIWREAQPPAGVEYRATDQDILGWFAFDWLPDDVVTMTVWVDPDGTGERRVEASETVTVPRPPDPGNGFAWDNAQKRWVETDA